MYVVINKFKDLKDNHLYEKDAIYPYKKKKVDQERLDELMGSDNKLKKSLIKEANIGDLTDSQLIEYATIEGIDLRSYILNVVNTTELEKLKKKAKKLKIDFNDDITLEELTSLIAEKESSEE